MGRHLVAASDSVGVAFAVWEFADFTDFVGGDGDGDELCDVVTGLDVLSAIAGVVEADFYGSGETTVYNAGAVAEYEVLFNARAAAHEQHAYMAFRYGHVNTGVAYAVATHGDCQVVG